MDLESAQSSIAQLENVLKTVGSEVAALEVEQEAPPRVAKLESAEVVHSNDSRRQMAALAGARSALLVVVLGISYWEFRHFRVQSPAELIQELGGRVCCLPRAAARLAEAALFDHHTRRRLCDVRIGRYRGW